MRSDKLAIALESCAHQCERLGAVDAAEQLGQLAAFLRPLAELSIVELCRRVQPNSMVAHRAQATSTSKPSGNDLAVTLDALGSIGIHLAGGGATIDAFKLLSQLFREDSDYLPDSLKSKREALVQDNHVGSYAAKLRAATGTDQFDRIWAGLAESSVKREFVVEVAREIVGRVATSTTKKAALALIRRGHDMQLSAKRGIAATGGRSAA